MFCRDFIVWFLDHLTGIYDFTLSVTQFKAELRQLDEIGDSSH